LAPVPPTAYDGPTMAVSPKPRPPVRDHARASDSEPSSKNGEQAFRTLSGEPVRELYTAEDLPQGIGGPEDPIGRPGSYPFTRGIHETMYRGRLWTMRQFAGYGTSEETNARFRYLLDHGQTGCPPPSTCPR
jgi:methylmalonyl-CoA mutase N-terminal domain/subunit